MSSFRKLNANGSSLLSPVAAKLKSVTVNTKGAAANILTLYDNAIGDTSGTVIAVIDTVNMDTQTLTFDLNTLVGLSATLATGTAADVTIVWE